jgi:hypothetical protein
VGGNFSAILWNVFFKEMKKIGVSHEAAKSYFEMINQNIAHNHSTAITGPLVRKDFPTMEKNLQALSKQEEIQEIYKDFVRNFSDSDYLT